jgi:RHS repeat-associated protein
MGARYYDPEIGRFLSMDPAAVDPNDPRTWNRYAYANNSPYNFTDPDGRESASIEWYNVLGGSLDQYQG